MLKTRKSIIKRFKITAKKKLLHRTVGQDHFNAKQSGNTTRKRHKQKGVSAITTKIIKKHIPHH